MYKTHKNYKYVQLKHKCILFFKDEAEIINGRSDRFENESYVFIPDGFIADDPLIDNLVYILNQIGCGSIIWIKDPPVESGYSFISFKGQDAEERFVEGCDIKVGEYALVFPKNAKALYRDGRITFTAPGGLSVLSLTKEELAFNAVSAHLELDGELAGSIVFSLSKSAGLLDGLNPGFEYAVDSGGHIHYPLFKSGQDASVSAAVNPSAPLNGSATFFKLEAQAPLVTNFNSIYGHEVAISPEGERSLVFEQKGDKLYIGPCGRYSIIRGDGTLMLDFNGREYLTYEKGRGSIIFHPHCKSNISVRGASEQPGKTTPNDAFTAAWAEFTAGTKHTRICKPLANGSDQKGLNVDETTLEGNLTVPVVPYCGIGAALQKKFIKTVDKGISNLRNNEIILKYAGHGEKAALKGAATCSGGLMYRMGANGQWDRLYLANTYQSAEPNVYISGYCEGLNGMLNQQDIFIYYTEPDISNGSSEETISKALFVDECRVETNAFDFVLKEPANGSGVEAESSWRSSGTTRTAFMFKRRHTGNSILDLMNSGGRSYGNHTVFQAAYRRALDENGNPRKGFEHFINTINDPEFEGTIILNCPVQAKDMPQKLSLIVNSMDPEKIYAHHLILPMGELSSEQGVCQLSCSPVFSVVLYEPNSMIVNTEETDEVGFVTNNAVICMRNGASGEDSRVDMIYCACELMVNRLFGSNCVVEGAKSGNCMLLDGVYQNSGDLHNYSFTLRNPVSYSLDSSAISSLSVESVQCSFDTDGGGGVFTLSGKLDFINPDGCDLFSYGSSGQEGVEGLAYHGLQIAIGSDMKLSVLYGSISFDIKGSSMRPNSFKDRFVCEFEKMVSGNNDLTPEGMGYGSITCPVKQGKLSGDWYGLVWKVHLGDFGSGQKGVPLDIRLLTAWSSGGKAGEPMLFIGMQLPMGLNTEGLDIMGILNLGFNSIELIARDNVENGERDYILQLHHFALKLLGISLPPGSNDIFIFSDGESLGWYAGYLK